MKSKGRCIGKLAEEHLNIPKTRLLWLCCLCSALPTLQEELRIENRELRVEQKMSRSASPVPLLLLLVFVFFSGYVEAYKNYTVGDSLGWYDKLQKPDVNYQKWVAGKNFSLGDFLRKFFSKTLLSLFPQSISSIFLSAVDVSSLSGKN